MVMRLVTKAAKLSTWGHDDTSIVFAFLLLVLEIFYVVSLAVIKASILFFFLRIFPERGFRRTLWMVQALNLLIAIAFLIFFCAQCQPFSYFWNQWDGEHQGKCAGFNKAGLTHVALNIALDIIMLVLPLTQIYKLQMDRRKKIGVMAMFLVGVFCLRIKSLSELDKVGNMTLDSVAVVLWAHVELGVGIMVACMPNVWHFVKTTSKKVHRLSTNMASYNGSLASYNNRTVLLSNIDREKPKSSIGDSTTVRTDSITAKPMPSP
ncbi:hypothetical protein CCHL11_03138 [Colletotrichum chlorophyti]|uniref:Rhodopsin domain-containing protein n=1 Tax=Colletotrichum chlorophyti TaxID=708187 RepID=A0A1Q8RGC8_9PEZI|nr:hypothetical protein CCHL11_03138 [Colletotrichum chlorophyti]